MNQDRTELINLDNVVAVVMEEVPELDQITYWVDTISNDTIFLGKYEDTPEHENQVERIAKADGAINVYYMPEE